MLVGEDEFLDSSPLTKKELYELGIEHGKEKVLNDIEDIIKKNVWGTSKDGKAILFQFNEYKEDANCVEGEQ